mmetsp:Transcript_17263/g.20566  ORF Transcript_17263/g.20566 Transcript_17263/m.20566 type:complete len:183 (-) Transcript_17263:386-934(-)
MICSTCHTNVARYTCPKCQIPYCGIHCYRIHDLPNTTIDGSSSSSVGGGGRCTESFYRERVVEMGNLTLGEEGSVRTMDTILERSRIQYHSPHNDDHADHNDTNDAIVHCGKNSNTSSSTKLDDTVILTDEELMELAGYLMEQPLHNHDDMMTTRNNSNTNNTTTMMPLRYVTRRHNHNSNK